MKSILVPLALATAGPIFPQCVIIDVHIIDQAVEGLYSSPVGADSEIDSLHVQVVGDDQA